MKKILNTIKSTALCIRYPFLYPRNRWTGLHYNNFLILGKISDLYKESHDSGMDDGGHFETKVTNRWKYILWALLKFYHNYFLQLTHCLTDYTEWDALDEGWRNAFGKELLKELREAMIKDGGYKYLYRVRIWQIKEKWGALRIYLNLYCERTDSVIAKYEKLSSVTCISCGKPAVGRTTSWICPYCEDCKQALERDVIINTDDPEWFEYFKAEDTEAEEATE